MCLSSCMLTEQITVWKVFPFVVLLARFIPDIRNVIVDQLKLPPKGDRVGIVPSSSHIKKNLISVGQTDGAFVCRCLKKLLSVYVLLGPDSIA